MQEEPQGEGEEDGADETLDRNIEIMLRRFGVSDRSRLRI